MTTKIILILFGISVWGFGIPATAADFIPVSPPLITLIPRDLGNNEIWYIGGSASTPSAEIMIYLRSATGETMGFTTKTGGKGEWFYTHNGFLREGKYTSWAQMRIGDELSPPSPEVAFEIMATAVRIGPYRVSWEILYLVFALLMLLILTISSIFAIYHFRHYHIKSSRLRREIREAETEARKGFELLRKDVKEEIEFLGKIKMSRELSIEENRREEKLLTDLNFIEQHILKEIGDIELSIP